MAHQHNPPGRPSKAAADRKRKTNLMLSPSVIAYLDAASANSGISKSSLAEMCIRQKMAEDRNATYPQKVLNP